jgi:hypothetical protein
MQRFLGMVLVGLSGAITVVAGIGLSAVPEPSLENLLLPALGIFVLVAPTLLLGVYWVSKDVRPVTENQDEMDKTLALMDMLREKPKMSVQVLATKLDISTDDVVYRINDLVGLGLFTGYLSPSDGGRVALIEPAVLQATTRCAICGAPLAVERGMTACTSCQTAYFLN